jgi:hypothetical protein
MTLGDVVFSHGCLNLDNWVGSDEGREKSIDDFCNEIHDEFQKLTTYENLSDTDFYRKFLTDETDDAGKHRTVIWERDDGDLAELDRRIARLNQDVGKRVYVRGHDKTSRMKKFHLKTNGSFQEFEDIGDDDEPIHPTDRVNIMADAYYVNNELKNAYPADTISLPYSIIRVSDKDTTTISAGSTKERLGDGEDDGLVDAIINQFDAVVLKFGLVGIDRNIIVDVIQ